MTRFAVDPADVIVGILRLALPDVTIRASIPDGVPELVPLVVVRRTGGSSLVPEFWDQPITNVQNWAAHDGDIDASRAASDLADQIRRALWTAWRQQTVVAAGHIAGIREFLGPMEAIDPDLPHLGRYTATYELLVRPVAA